LASGVALFADGICHQAGRQSSHFPVHNVQVHIVLLLLLLLLGHLILALRGLVLFIQ
jgi:hypothetical protein